MSVANYLSPGTGLAIPHLTHKGRLGGRGGRSPKRDRVLDGAWGRDGVYAQSDQGRPVVVRTCCSVSSCVSGTEEELLKAITMKLKAHNTSRRSSMLEWHKWPVASL